MSLFGDVIQISGITYQMFLIFAVILVGYLLGRITIKGVNLGAAGIFIVALVFGAFFGKDIHDSMTVDGMDITASAFSIIETTGLVLFVGAVGMIAGPNFFRNLKKNFKSYILIGIIIILGGALASIICYYIGLGSVHLPEDLAQLGIGKNQYMISMIAGIMSGALTSTPAYSAAMATAATVVPADAAASIKDAITIGHGIAYIFGVIGVVLFVQLIPRFMKADIAEERKKIIIDTGQEMISDVNKKRFEIDGFGFGAFAFVVIVGIFFGMIRIPLSSQGLSGTTFSLTVTGGVLISGLVFAHFGHIGPVSLKVKKHVLEVFREFGLIMFLIGSGIPGGASFAKYFQPVYFVYGIIITIVPMIIGYFVAKKLLKLPLLNSLGSITGGMTSTPALGTLIRLAGTDEVAASYATVYPIALICVVFASQFMILIFGR